MNIPRITFIKISKREIIIISIILIISLLGYVFVNTREQGSIAIIEVSQKLYGSYDLSIDQNIAVNDSEGLVLIKCEIKDKKIYVVSSTCPDKICINQGTIGSSGQTIVCLPNKIVIKVINSDEPIDGVLK